MSACPGQCGGFPYGPRYAYLLLILSAGGHQYGSGGGALDIPKGKLRHGRRRRIGNRRPSRKTVLCLRPEPLTKAHSNQTGFPSNKGLRVPEGARMRCRGLRTLSRFIGQDKGRSPRRHT